jgi:hypothetical protein
MPTAQGPFDVRLVPLPLCEIAAASQIIRKSVDKDYRGDLVGSARGELFSMMTAVPGSGGYVAMERVTGTLGGRRGSFVLQHSSTMTSAGMQQSVQVTPDSGTDDLVGLSGTMSFSLVDGQHHYRFDYALA